ncbi:phosphocholine-specific phospholipase C [Stakelama marina]|uniref:phospholipase C n=1 Tax=Stakelama marina TaxID=2826939 RepID=A0A8T4I9H7_9SPHN|nr:phospholipase C, phosphocholine-specific [Stakelama marina]MBR0551668.1 phospholipase C, phosphocholine-specific [Stakelama marina]
MDRRAFLHRISSLAAAGALPAPIARALARPAKPRTGTIRDVEHVVILMQENRSFDHYFGTLAGVRGYGDPRPMRLRNGQSVFHQPDPAGGAVLPFHLDSRTTSAQLLKSLDHSWKGDTAEWADYDVWIKHKTAMSMGHFRRADIPFYYALADAFSVCDAYYASIHGPTDPNRMFLFSGTSGLAAGNAGPQAVSNADDGNWTADASRDNDAQPGYSPGTWTTYAERLQAAGISWRLYQEYDNYGDNSLAYFRQFRGLDPASPLYRRGRAIVPGSTAENADDSEAKHLIAAFAADVEADRLPQVSWLVAPTKYCEHPEAPPAYGESLTSRIIDALLARPDVWEKTALIINYDENDGFFDHMPAPLPATNRAMGLSSIDTRGEVYQGQSVGLGVRVPLIVVSPWSRGGWVNSQVHDHTSVIRFLERRFGVMEPNITPWRRAVTGDLTGMFDFADPDGAALHAFPDTTGYLERVAAEAKLPPPAIPARQSVPRQEPGRRPARPLPYELEVEAEARDDGLHFRFVNHGAAAAVFNVYADGDAGPWFYTVGAGGELTDRLPGHPVDGRHDIRVHGPNGFFRQFVGVISEHDAAAPIATLRRKSQDMLELAIANHGEQPQSFVLDAPTYGEIAADRFTLLPGARRLVNVPLAANDHWYDLRLVQQNAHFVRRFSGHIETGRASRSDPALG